MKNIFTYFVITIFILLTIALTYLRWKYKYSRFLRFPTNANTITNTNTKPQKEDFKANANLLSNTPMNFDYLKNYNYKDSILATYYLNDDKKINGYRTVFHPYMYKYPAFFTGAYNYGSLYWFPELSNIIYQTTGNRL